MDDAFLHSLRHEPSPEFVQKLRIRLRRPVSKPFPVFRLAASVAIAAALSLLLTLPSVRAGAQAFLDLFRIVNFAAVSFDDGRLQQLRSQSFDLPQLLGEQIEVQPAKAQPMVFPTPQAAAVAAGMAVKLPAWTPVGWEIERVAVSSEYTMRITADTSKLESLLAALEIRDLPIPQGIDGQQVTLHVSPIVMIGYRHPSQPPDRVITLFQSRSPSVALPAGLDLATLGEVGLRILGMGRVQAHRFAQSIDWRTTLIVPVPASVANFRQVDIQGSPGIAIEKINASGRGRNGTLLLWSTADRVFALQGHVRPEELLEMAQTLR